MSSNRVLLQAIYAAFNRREMETVLAAMHPNVNWPNGMEGGRIHGTANVSAYWTRQWNMVNPRVEPVRIEDDEDGNTVVDVHQVVHDLSGKLLIDHTIQHVYTIQNGLIERMEIREKL